MTQYLISFLSFASFMICTCYANPIPNLNFWNSKSKTRVMTQTLLSDGVPTSFALILKFEKNSNFSAGLFRIESLPDGISYWTPIVASRSGVLKVDSRFEPTIAASFSQRGNSWELSMDAVESTEGTASCISSEVFTEEGFTPRGWRWVDFRNETIDLAREDGKGNITLSGDGGAFQNGRTRNILSDFIPGVKILRNFEFDPKEKSGTSLSRRISSVWISLEHENWGARPRYLEINPKESGCFHPTTMWTRK